MNYKDYFETVADGNTTRVAFRTLLLHSSLFFPVIRWVEGYYTITLDLRAQAEAILHLRTSTICRDVGRGLIIGYTSIIQRPVLFWGFVRSPQPVQVTVMTRTLALLLTPPLQPPASPQLSRLSSAHRRMSEVSACVCTSSLPVCC